MKALKKLCAAALIFSVVSSAALISAQAATIAYGAGLVSCDALNVRASANTSAAVSAIVHRGDTVVLLENAANGWYHVSAGGTIGYVSSEFITGVETAKNFTANGALSGNDVRMRSTPSTSGSVLGTYSTGTAVKIIGINSGWYKVTLNGTTGYIRSDFITLDGTSQTSTAVSTTQTAAPAQRTVTPAPAPSPEKAALGKQIAQFAYQFVGYNYVYGAESPEDGFDCSGLCYYVYGQFGYDICRTASQQFANDGIEVSKDQLQPGDLVFFSSDGEGVTHVGLYFGDGKFVNASTSRVGVIFSDLGSDYYTRVWYGAKRII